MANLKLLMDSVMEKAGAYAKAYNEHQKKPVLKALKKSATDAVNGYNLELSKATYRQWAKEGDPIKTAIRTLYIPGAKKLKFKVDDEDYMTVIADDFNDYEVNLPMMQATIGASAFTNPGWFAQCQKLMFLVSNTLNEHFNDSPMFKLSIDDAAKAFEFPDGIDPLSDEGVVHALQMVYDSILLIPDPDSGENVIKTRLKQDKHGKFYSTEWDYIRESMTANGGVGKVDVCDTGKFSSFILHTMHLILTNGTISLGCPDSFVMPKDDVEGDAGDSEGGEASKETAE